MTLAPARASQSQPALPPEQAALLACARRLIRPEDPFPDSSSETESIQWGRLLRLALENRILPALHQALEAGCLPAPDSFRNEIAALMRNIARRNLLLTREMLKLVERFDAARLNVIPFKGPVLAALLYGDLGGRAFYDLDFLVRRADLPRAGALLESEGYRLSLSSKRSLDAIHLRTEYHFPFVKDHGSILLELHHDLVPVYFGPSLEEAGLWARRRTIEIGGRTVATLSAEDLVIALCLHAAKHRFQFLDGLCGIGLLSRRSSDVQWEEVVERCTRIGARRMVALAFLLCRELLGTDLPEPVGTLAQQDPKAAILTREILGEFSKPSAPRPDVLRTPRFHLRCRERRRDRLRYCLLSVFAPNWEELEWMPLPRVMFPLYWLLRPVRLVSSYAPLLWRYFRGTASRLSSSS